MPVFFLCVCLCVDIVVINSCCCFWILILHAVWILYIYLVTGLMWMHYIQTFVYTYNIFRLLHRNILLYNGSFCTSRPYATKLFNVWFICHHLMKWLYFMCTTCHCNSFTLIAERTWIWWSSKLAMGWKQATFTIECILTDYIIMILIWYEVTIPNTMLTVKNTSSSVSWVQFLLLIAFHVCDVF